jgi:hypothetical protein
MLCNICNNHICIYVHICWRMCHHQGILGQFFWLDGKRLGLGSMNQCKWMLLQLVHEFISSNGYGLT